MVEFEKVELVVLEGLFNLTSKISFKAVDVHDSGYLLPLEAVRNRKTLKNQGYKLYTMLFLDNVRGFISLRIGLI